MNPSDLIGGTVFNRPKAAFHSFFSHYYSKEPRGCTCDCEAKFINMWCSNSCSNSSRESTKCMFIDLNPIIYFIHRVRILCGVDMSSYEIDHLIEVSSRCHLQI